MATDGFKYAKLGNDKLCWFWLAGGSAIITQSLKFLGKTLNNFGTYDLQKKVKFL